MAYCNQPEHRYPRRSNMKTSIATVSISGNFAEKLEAIAAAGFHGLEIFEQDLVLSDKCEPVSEWPVTVALCRTELTPLSESGSAVKLEVFSAVEVAFLVEMIVDRRVDGDEFLQGSHAPKADHCPFSSSEWLM